MNDFPLDHRHKCAEIFKKIVSLLNTIGHFAHTNRQCVNNNPQYYGTIPCQNVGVAPDGRKHPQDKVTHVWTTKNTLR